MASRREETLAHYLAELADHLVDKGVITVAVTGVVLTRHQQQEIRPLSPGDDDLPNWWDGRRGAIVALRLSKPCAVPASNDAKTLSRRNGARFFSDCPGHKN
jgi:hypothetical protein